MVGYFMIRRLVRRKRERQEQANSVYTITKEDGQQILVDGQGRPIQPVPHPQQAMGNQAQVGTPQYSQAPRPHPGPGPSNLFNQPANASNGYKPEQVRTHQNDAPPPYSEAMNTPQTNVQMQPGYQQQPASEISQRDLRQLFR